ncbi:MAG: GC-type dockerin domain-anchored protein [Phycisphaerales bacterium]
MRTCAVVGGGIRRTAALAAVAGLAVGASSARATIINWNNAAGGAAATAANWNPAQVPTAADTLVYNLNSTYTVTFSGAVGLSTQHTYKRGTVSLSMSSPHTLSGNLRVGDVSGDVATAIVTTGDVTAGSVTVGNAAGSTGTLRVNDNDARLFTSGAGDVVVGAAGTGTLIINGGGVVQSADDVILGSAGGDGTASVSGFGITPIRFSSLGSSGVDGDIIVGNFSGSTCSLSVTDSGIVSASDDLLVGPISGASGSVNVGGNGNVATLSVGGDLQVGNNTSSTSAGSGQVSALNGGTIDVTGTIRLGDTTVGSGTLSCRDGGMIRAHSIICDADGGFLNLLGGMVDVSVGSVVAPGGLLTLNGAAGEQPILRLVQGASASFSSTTPPFRALTIGETHLAALLMDTSASLTVSAGDAVVGHAAGSSGYLRFGTAAQGTFASTSRLIIGNSGDGTMEIAGGSVSCGEVDLGATPTGTGLLALDGSGSVLNASQPIYVGGTSSGGSGIGELRVEGGAVLNANAAIFQTSSICVWRTDGALVVGSGGTLNAAQQIYVEGAMTLDGGVVNCGQVLYIGNDPNTNTYNFNGVINTELQMLQGHTTLNLTGPLDIHAPSNRPAFNNRVASVAVGNNVLTLDGGESPLLGNCTLGASGVINSNQSILLDNSRELSGDGTINSNITNQGTMTATGDGLTLSGIVENAGGTMNGVRFTFVNGGGFTGAGSISAKVVAQQGSKVTITGNSVIGDGSTFAATIEGELEITAGTLTVNDSNGIGLGTLTTVHQGGTLLCTSVINMGNVPTTDVIQGGGEVAGIVNCAGVIRPGFEGQDETGELAFNTLNLFAGTVKGEVDIDLAGAAAADCDRIRCFGPVTLDGLLKVQLINGFEPANGFRALIISSTQSVSGDFVTKNLPARWHVEIGPKNVVAVYCAGDVNSDGFVNGDDFDELASAFENGEPLGDFNGDGFINGDDFDQFASAFEEGC